MAHEHHHHGDDTYFVNQLCMIALAGAFGAICLSLFLWQSAMLTLMLGPQFHKFVLGSGITLLVISGVRAVLLWNEKPSHTHHNHDHQHSHFHDHHHHDDGHSHHHDHPHHDHEHHHHDAHSHTHADHSHEDHDHGWAPWRYVVLLVPILLFLLGLPNRGPKAANYHADVDPAIEAAKEAGTLSTLVGLDGWSQLAWLANYSNAHALGDVMPADFKRLLTSQDDAGERGYFADKTVELRGQFVPDPRDSRYFALVRFKQNCCAADAVDKRVAVVSKEPITHIKRDDWAKVIGKVEYRKRDNAYVVRLTTIGPALVQPCNPDVNPYIQ